MARAKNAEFIFDNSSQSRSKMPFRGQGLAWPHANRGWRLNGCLLRVRQLVRLEPFRGLCIAAFRTDVDAAYVFLQFGEATVCGVRSASCARRLRDAILSDDVLDWHDYSQLNF